MIRIAIIAAALVLTTTACNTIDGAGEDIKSVGREGKKVLD